MSISSQNNEDERKYASIAYLLWGLGFFGVCGLQRMYVGQYRLGTAMLFTLGFLGIGQLMDSIIIPELVNPIAERDSTLSDNSYNPYGQPDTYLVWEDEHGEVPSSDIHEPSVSPDEWDLEQAVINEKLEQLKENS
jgi:TM2 domain-containing membrane protein YozV